MLIFLLTRKKKDFVLDVSKNANFIADEYEKIPHRSRTSMSSSSPPIQWSQEFSSSLLLSSSPRNCDQVTSKCAQCSNDNNKNSDKSMKHQRKIFKCSICSYACSWAYDFSLHLRQKHGIQHRNMKI